MSVSPTAAAGRSAGAQKIPSGCIFFE